MTDKELNRLSRSALIDIIYELQQQNQQLEVSRQQLQQELSKRELILANAGSIAEAALQINGVMEAAQAAAEQYLLSLKAVSSKAEESATAQEAKEASSAAEAER